MYFLSITNFQKILHYRARAPIWVKLHCSLLDDFEFSRLSDNSKFHYFALLLLAARLGNKLPDDTKWLQSRINSSSEINLDELIVRGFLERIDASKFASIESKSYASNLLAQNTTQHNRIEENKSVKHTHNTTQNRSASELTKSVHSRNDILNYVKEIQKEGCEIKNIYGLTEYLSQTGNSDERIEEYLTSRDLPFEPDTAEEPCEICNELYCMASHRNERAKLAL